METLIGFGFKLIDAQVYIYLARKGPQRGKDLVNSLKITKQQLYPSLKNHTQFKTVKYWALRAMRWFRLKGLIILRSSKNHYHVVFDRSVTWERNMHIVAWVALESGDQKLKDYLVMQCIKESSTLRVSGKGERPIPRIVFKLGTQKNEIRRFLFLRRHIRKIVKAVSVREQHPFGFCLFFSNKKTKAHT